MIISHKNVSPQVEQYTITVEASDYQSKVDEKLKGIKKSANIPGFRPGMAPISLIKKMYGRSVLPEVSYNQAIDALFADLKENNVNFIAEPLPSEDQPQIEFVDGENISYSLDVAVIDAINLDLSAIAIDKYTLMINDEMREGYSSNLLNRFGELVDVEEIAKDEAVSVTLSQEDMTIEDAYVGLISMNDSERAPFIGKKVGDTMVVNVNELYKTPSQRASILSVSEEELENINPEFNLTVTRIRKFALPERNEEFFAKAFPDGSIANEEQFKAYVEAQLRNDLDRETYYKLVIDTRNKVLEASGVVIPEEFVKRWLYTINEGKVSREDIDRDYPQFVDMMRWDIVKRDLAAESGVKVEQEELLAEAKRSAQMQFMQYGMQNVEEEMLENYARQILSNKEEQRRIFDSIYDMKLVDYITPKAIVVDREVTIEEFRELVK